MIDLSRFSHLSLEKALEFYFVFDGFEFSQKYHNLHEAIYNEILLKYEFIKNSFNFTHDKQSRQILQKLARSDRKRFSLTRHLPRNLSINIMKEFLQNNIIYIEKSHEIKPVSLKHQKIKKEFRRYQVQDKIHFSHHFTRFWFYFCEPNLKHLQNNDFEFVLNIIKTKFEEYCSLAFELVCIDFLAQSLNIDKTQITSYWDKNVEIDIFCKTKDLLIVGEVKFKSRKVCKNILNLLKAKCQSAGFEPDLYVIFSRFGFSKELSELKNDKILLFELDDFKEIL